MEELKKLEHVQETLTFLESCGFISSSSSTPCHSNRFLANLILLLIQPCGDLDMEAKCSLITEHVPKITPSFLEEASLSLNQQGCEGNSVGIVPSSVESGHCIPDGQCGHVPCGLDDLAAVGLDALQRANSTLEDFCRSYFMFHGMDVNRTQLVFKYLPLLSFTESYIYQIDGLNEKIVKMAINEEEVISKTLMDIFKVDPFRPLLVQLERHGLVTDRIIEEFRQGEEYWTLERKLCSVLTNQREISVEDVMRAINLKSFDYRVLNLLLYQLRGEKVNDMHMEFLSVSEFLVELSDDLFDYEDDVLENSFNVLRMFVRIYGPSTAPAMLAKCITDAEERYDTLLSKLEPHLALNYQRRCEDATKEGGKISGHPLGMWSIPPVIVDEDLYRSNVLKS